MTSNLRICYPDIPIRATVLSSPTPATGYAVENLFSGGRTLLYKANVAALGIGYQFDLGSAGAVDYGALGRINLIPEKEIGFMTLRIKGSGINSFVGAETQSADFFSTDLMGPGKEDFVAPFTFSTTYRYWQVEIFSGASVKHQLSKMYFGQAFDFGRDPLYPRPLSRANGVRGQRRPPYKLSLTWKGITDAKRTTFLNSIYMNKDISPVFLWAPNYSEILSGNKMLCCRIVDAEITPDLPDSSTVRCDFEELV